MSDTLDEKDNNGFIATEVLDRKERKALKDKMRAEAKVAKQKIPVDEIEATLSRSRLAVEKRKQRMNVLKLAIAGVVLCLLGWFVYYLFAPYKGGKPYGICRTFLEMNVQFPQDLRLSSMEKFEDSIRIWFLQVDAFGEYRMENIQCYYKKHDYSE